MSNGKGGNKRGAKDSARAAYMKAHHIVRDTGMCPWGCGRALKNGGEHLLNHLTRCQGSRPYDRRRRARTS